MALLPRRRETRQPLASLRSDIDRLFEDFIGRGGDLWPAEWHGWTDFPTVDVHEAGNTVEVTAELPGINTEELDISVHGETLTIRGEKKEEHEDESKTSYRVERRYGSFERTVPLPCEVNPEKSEANYKDGVLKISLPKKQEAARKKKKIPVK